MSSLLGGSKQKSQSTSSNQAYNTINSAFSPLLGYASEGASGISALLGGDTSGLDKYREATGFNTQMSQGLQNVTNAGAAKGLLRSGATGKGLVQFGNDLSQQSSNNYMDKLLGLAGLGNQAGGILSGAGQTSQSTSSGKSKKGIGEMLGTAASVAAMSDRRLKTNIKKLGEYEDGLGKYSYEYIWEPGKTIEGVMADEVAELRPWALGPEIGGYASVDYGKL
jgi:hypothetical protein